MISTRALFALAVACFTLDRPGRAAQPIDYILPDARESRPEPAVIVGAEAAPGADDVVAYRSFDGHDYTLNRIRGKQIDVLLPDSWFGADLITPVLGRRLVDKLDILYSEYQETLGAEPPGPAKTSVAFVTTCGYGCGYVGYKGVEIAPDTGAQGYILPYLKQDILQGVFHHEFAHNFDLYNNYLHYEGGDFAHAWTEYFHDFGGTIYNQSGSESSTADEARIREHTMLFEKYIKDPKQTWQTCFKVTASPLCPHPNDVWAGTLVHFGAMHGDQAVIRYFAYLKQVRDANTPAAATVEERTDLYLRALSEAVQQNTACYADAWRWYISPALRAELTAKFGATAPACLDVDGDTRQPVIDDCNDGNAAISGKAKEVAGNQIDDDCDFRVDEKESKEAADFPSNLALTLPAQVVARLGNTADRDSFEVNFPKTTWIYTKLCSSSTFSGWLSIDKGSQTHYHFTWAENCGNGGFGEYHQIPAGKRRFEVFRYDKPGPYTFELLPGIAWPPTGWTTLKPAVVQGAQIVLKAPTAVGARFATTPTHVRFWVSGFGVVGERPYKPTTAFRWTPPTPIPAGTTYRAQALTNGVPSSAYSQAAVVPPSSL